MQIRSYRRRNQQVASARVEARVFLLIAVSMHYFVANGVVILEKINHFVFSFLHLFLYLSLSLSPSISLSLPRYISTSLKRNFLAASAADAPLIRRLRTTSTLEFKPPKSSNPHSPSPSNTKTTTAKQVKTCSNAPVGNWIENSFCIARRLCVGICMRRGGSGQGYRMTLPSL